ncbi:hypothetical protein NQ317_000187 [Molorchus minor]|uniref:VWFC domain-containing protein n=1 Tax=Molorchus minor TaxID=1323400 RepID=A0ABQ9J7L3_9CUCU|nr:hypothetical protein NQ317_000187 [Molorchus minor]
MERINNISNKCTSKSPHCWYDDKRYEESEEVATAEPCLNCTCSKGILLCYLRVCPKLPNPPPPGCILLHSCISELSGGGNSLEPRSDLDNDLDRYYDRRLLGNDFNLILSACMLNGSIYGPGSAMHSSSLCEYCYCLGGKQTCVKPKCLLPIEGCTPAYDPASCCPTHYNCTAAKVVGTTRTTSSTTTSSPKEIRRKGGCLVDRVYHPEGGKVLGIGHSVCDNCYCMKGLVRCEPLSCAPPLLGCTPVIKPGECCAASYNCSGTIEIQPEPNYGDFPIVSKDYAKLRKEVNRKVQKQKDGVVTVEPFYVLAESLHSSTTKLRSAGTLGTTRHFTGVSFNPSTTKPYYYNSMTPNGSNSKHSTREKLPEIYYATTNYVFQNTNYKRVYSTTTKPKPGTGKSESTTSQTINAIVTTDYKDAKVRTKIGDINVVSKYDPTDERLNRKVENETEVSTTEIPIADNTDEVNSVATAVTTENPTDTEPNIIYDPTTESENFTTESYVSTTDSITNTPHFITLKTVLNSTDCKQNKDSLNVANDNNPEATTALPVDANEINNLAELKASEYEDLFGPTDSSSTEDYSESTTKEVTTELDLVSKVPSATLRNIPDLPPRVRPDIEAILNITKHKVDDYDYDYNEPSLPPSLPNLKIIPFVAADALDVKKEEPKENVVHHEEKLAIPAFGYGNMFSPPIETEGGFIPKDPPLLDTFYENAVSSPSITSDPKLNNADCLDHEGNQIAHGQSVPSPSPCVTCTCFYGNIVCQKPTCPVSKPGCRKSPVQGLTLCCPNYICDNEAPTVVLGRLDINQIPQEIATVAERVVSPDPFRDVIRTEPAPDLQSLIVDMMPFFTRKTTPLAQVTDKQQVTRPVLVTTTMETISEANDNKINDDLSLDKVLELLFSSNDKENSQTQFNKIQTTTAKTKDDDILIVSTTSAPPIEEKTNLKEVSTENLKHGVNMSESISNSNSVDSSGVGLLKLAGCNIYGRMYRVGRIISELSGPCLECKCTEIGVQCRALKCNL